MLVDKPAGMTSHDVVQRVRRALGIKAVGHTGTLDPFATGLLVVLVGRATRLARFVEADSKTYLAVARLGIRTNTDDLTGEVQGPPAEVNLSQVQVRNALEGFLGTHSQRPPQFSAKRVAGERSYRKARRGEAVDLKETPVTVHAVELVEYRPPELTFRITVSAGTYVRAIARDLGDRLGVGAHLISLRREAVGSLKVEDAISPERVTASVVLPPQQVLGDIPRVSLDQSEHEAVKHGRAVVDSGQQGSGAAVLMANGELVAVASVRDGWLHPTVVLQSP